VSFSFTALLDFTIPVITITPATPTTNGIFTATVTVKNQGIAAGDGGQLRLWANQPTAQTCAATGGDKNLAVGIVAAGASKVLTFTGINAGISGTKTLRILVDATCARVETNELNNQLAKTYQVISKPDFIVTNIVLTPATLAANATFNAAVTVKNQGTGAGDGKFLDVWSHQPNGQTCGAVGNKRLSVGVLAAGASKTLTFTGVVAGVAGAKTFRAFVDSGCGTVETKEANNQMIKAYTVQ
jgi:subtilase family serine protease